MKQEFSIDSYVPIDYSNFVDGDGSKRGYNITDDLLKFPSGRKFLRIWEDSYKYRGQRNDPEQEEMVTRFVMEIMKYEDANPNVVIPAAMLHDTGFYYVEDKNAWKANVNAGGATEGETKRRPHQNRGIMIAGNILTKVDYSLDYFCEIADIIGDHDTRLLPTTENGLLMREADYLWRITYTDMRHYFKDKDTKWHFDRMTGGLLDDKDDGKGGKIKVPVDSVCLYAKPPFDLRPAALGIGRVELINSLYIRNPEETLKMIPDTFEAEVEKIYNFYKNKKGGFLKQV